MKKNITRLVLQMGKNVKPQKNSSLKITTQQVSKYTNKILVDSQELEKPTIAQKFVNQQMEDYPSSNENVEQLKKNIHNKMDKKPSFQQRLAYISSSQCSDVLALQDFLIDIRLNATKEHHFTLRDKLIKLQYDIGFKLQGEQLDQHVAQSLKSFLIQLNQIINKTTKVY